MGGSACDAVDAYVEPTKIEQVLRIASRRTEANDATAPVLVNSTGELIDRRELFRVLRRLEPVRRERSVAVRESVIVECSLVVVLIGAPKLYVVLRVDGEPAERDDLLVEGAE